VGVSMDMSVILNKRPVDGVQDPHHDALGMAIRMVWTVTKTHIWWSVLQLRWGTTITITTTRALPGRRMPRP